MEFPWVEGQVVWSLADQDPELHALACAAEPQLPGFLADLDQHFPTQTQPEVGQWGNYIRPRGHWRAWYYQISDHSTLAIKGSEAHAQDYQAMLQTMQSRSSEFSYSLARPGAVHRHVQARFSVLERFLVLENKFPGSLLLSEALSEAGRALQFQSAHSRRYGQLARVPLPLVVHRVHPGQVSGLVALLASLLEPRQRLRLRNLEDLGLGVLVYWYPGLPLRVAHQTLPPLGPYFTLAERLAALSHDRHPREVLDNWLDLMARMLCLGFVPADPMSALSGLCLEPQNLTLDGGMVDLNSLRAMDSFEDVLQAGFALQRSLQVLASSVVEYLFGGVSETLHGQLQPAMGSLIQGLRHRCQVEQDQGHLLPDPVARWLEAADPFDSLTLSMQTSLPYN